MQHREWNPKVFLRKVSREILALYEEKAGIRLEGDPSAPAAERAYGAWKALPEGQRRALEAELLPVNDLCTQHARSYLDAFAADVWTEELLEQSREWSAYDVALRLFVDAPEALRRAHQSFAIDRLQNLHEFRGRYRAPVRATPETKARMRDAMLHHLRLHVGKARCRIEDFEGDGKLAIFVHHEQEVTPVDRFAGEQALVSEWQRPVVRAALVYYPNTATLLVKAPRKREREKVRDLFAEHFIGDGEFFADVRTTPRFSFDVLSQPDFAFATNPADGIVRVTVSQLTLGSLRGGVAKATLDFHPNHTLEDVRAALRTFGLYMHNLKVDGIRLRFEFSEGSGNARFRTANVGNPNRSNLSDVERDRLIRSYLQEWGIDECNSDSVPVAVPPMALAAVA